MKKPVSRKQVTQKSKTRQVKETRLGYGSKRVASNQSSAAPRTHRENGFRRALKQEKVRLQAELKIQQVASQDHPTTGNHMADDATDVAEQAKTLALRTHLEGMLKEVDRALARMEKGTFGLCEKCGDPIGDERLQAMPWDETIAGPSRSQWAEKALLIK